MGTQQTSCLGYLPYPLCPTLVTNSGFGVCSNSTLENVGSAISITSISSGVCVTSNTQGLTVGKLVKFSSGTVTGTYIVTALTTNSSFTLHDTSKTDAGSHTAYEVTPGFVAADTKCFDRWTKTSGVQAWRWYDPTQTYITGLYGAKVTGDGSSGTVQHSDGSQAALPQFYLRYAGRSLVMGCWCYTAAASKARIGLVQSSGTTWSGYHSGTAGKEWLEFPADIASNTTTFSIVLDAGISNTAYFSPVQMQFGSYVGSGNYVPIPQEMIWLDKGDRPFSSTIDNHTFANGATGTLYIQPETLGVIPASAKAVYLWAWATDAASASSTSFIIFSQNLTDSYEFSLTTSGLANGKMALNGGWCRTSGGICTYQVAASASGILLGDINITGVQLA